MTAELILSECGNEALHDNGLARVMFPVRLSNLLRIYAGGRKYIPLEEARDGIQLEKCRNSKTSYVRN